MKITLKQGELIGREESSFPSGRTYYSYCGIPYAEPPVNSFRFQVSYHYNTYVRYELKTTIIVCIKARWLNIIFTS